MPVSKVRVGVPATVTDALKATWIETVSPTFFVPSVVVEETDDTVGPAAHPVVLTTTAAFAESAVDDGSVSVALLPPISVIVPPFNVSDETSKILRSLVESPQITV